MKNYLSRLKNIFTGDSPSPTSFQSKTQANNFDLSSRDMSNSKTDNLSQREKLEAAKQDTQGGYGSDLL